MVQLPDFFILSKIQGKILTWVKQDLFPTKRDSAISLFLLVFLFWGAYKFIGWAVLNAVFLGEHTGDIAGGVSKVCANTEGACWAFIAENWSAIVYGLYPVGERWRIFLGIGIGIALASLYFSSRVNKRNLTFITLIIYPIFAWFFFSGGFWGLEKISTERWGGLFLTLVLASVGIVAAFPLGVLLALGRQSNLPVIRWFCVGFIEFFRGVPLISLLLVASAVFPLFLPSGANLNLLLRALIVIIFFQSAYLAEALRGGLQALPAGQYEAAQALGLGYWRMQVLIILPQAIKISIPSIVNECIALFKDITLVGIIGMLDLFGMVRQTMISPAWPNVAIEAYVFVAFVYWAFSFSMSKYGQRVERKLNTNRSLHK